MPPVRGVFPLNATIMDRIYPHYTRFWRVRGHQLIVKSSKPAFATSERHSAGRSTTPPPQSHCNLKIIPKLACNKKNKKAVGAAAPLLSVYSAAFRTKPRLAVELVPDRPLRLR